MEKVKLRRPFFVCNPKAYLYGEDTLKLARKCEELAVKYDFDVIYTAQHVDLAMIARECPHLIVTAQHMESLKPGRGMGHILPEALKAAGVKATFLNHAENSMTINELAKTIERANELGLLTIVCSNEEADTRAIAELHPDCMVCELTSLIGTGTTADESYMVATNNIVKSVSPETKTLQAAGISTGDDVYKAIKSGADATGGTSGIVAAPDPIAKLEEMFEALDRARKDFCQ